MKPVRFLFDEHIPLALLRALKRPLPAPDMMRVGQPEAPPFGLPDPAVLVWCEENERLLVSLDRSTLPRHFAEHISAGRHCWGVMLAPPWMSLSLLIQDLRLVAGASHAEDWFDRIVHLPL